MCVLFCCLQGLVQSGPMASGSPALLRAGPASEPGVMVRYCMAVDGRSAWTVPRRVCGQP